MLSQVRESKEARELLLHLLPVSGTLAGIAIGSLSLFQFGAASLRATVADDVLAFSALAFLLSCYLIFWALRARTEVLMLRICRVVDSVFLTGLTGIVAAGFLLVYIFV